MLAKLKRTIVYILAAVLTLPTCIITGLANPSKASAHDVTDRVFGIKSEEVTFFGYWSQYGDEMYTNGVAKSARTDVSEIAIDDPGDYKIEVQWRVWSDHTQHAEYEIKDCGESIATISNVNQQLKADGQSGINGEYSGYYNLGVHKLTGDRSRVRLISNGANYDDKNVSFVSVRLNHVNVVPSVPVLVAPVDGTAVKSMVSLDWDDSLDSDDQGGVSYQLQINDMPVIDSIASSSYPYSLTTLPDGTYSWKVRAYDGEDYSGWSDANTFIVDATGPVLTDLSIEYDIYEGIVLKSDDVKSKLLNGNYQIPLNQKSASDYQLSAANKDAVNEVVQDDWNKLFLSNLTQAQKDALISYYNNAEIPDNSVKDHYLKSVDGSEPFAYLVTGNDDLRLLDGAKKDIEALEEPLHIPGDFPLGIYSLKGQLEDLNGNVSEISIGLEFIKEVIIPSAPAAPEFTVTQTDGKNFAVKFKGVGNSVTSYQVYVNNIPTSISAFNNGDDSDHEYSYTGSVLEYGKSYPIKIVVYGPWNPSSVTSAEQSFSIAAPVAATTTTVTTAVATKARIVGTALAAAATPEGAGSTVTPPADNGASNTSDENGKIKGEEETTQAEEEDKVNWTPWIILFILIILAGAATGGYFYWFAGEEEVEKEIKKPVAAPVEDKKKEEDAPKPNSSKSGKKSRRW